jgi:PAS domain S-box-containing protein
MSPTRNPRSRVSRVWLAVGAVLVVLLAAAVFTLGSLSLPFEPSEPGEFTLLFALSTFIVAALFVFGLILVRSLLRLWAERQAGQLGSRFKTKMVFGAMGISLLPVIFMFFISYALLNRTLAKWFPRPLEIATQESQRMLNELGEWEHRRLTTIGQNAVRAENAKRDLLGRGNGTLAIRIAMQAGADVAWTVSPARGIEAGVGQGPQRITRGDVVLVDLETSPPRLIRRMPSGAELWQIYEELVLGARTPVGNGKGELVVARSLPKTFAARYSEVENQVATYRAHGQGLRAFKTQMLLTLLLFTVLLLFAATWFALFLSKQVTVPIQALAEATREVSRGNFSHQVDVQAHDELGTLVSSFNQMTAQLGQSQQQINEFTRSLQQAVTEIEQRRKLMETILENVPTGVLSLDATGTILRANHAVARIFGDAGRRAPTLAALAGEEAARGIEALMRKSLRLGTASKELEIALPGPDSSAASGRVLHAAVTVSSLGPRRENPGFVVVIDDLTELLRAQKAAAWQSVAQRIAHEIKNPLTPIQLSVQRLARHLERLPAPQNGELEKLAGECAALIEREVSALKSLVDEFSQFARFPAPRPVALEVNPLVASALEVFAGRLEGISVRTELTADLPLIKADPELLRRVLVNLIDNAAEAMEGATRRELLIATRGVNEGETLEIVVADTGHGISPEDKDKLFLPHFSTRSRGTGLGLAIAGRIVADHFGTIRAEDNAPAGARFVIRLPVAEVAAAESAGRRPAG